MRDSIWPQGQEETCFQKKKKGLFVLDGALEMWGKKHDLEYVECGMKSGVAANHMSRDK